MLFCLNCGSELLLDGRYRAISQLGEGGFGKTYEVLDRNNQPRVLKVLIENYAKYVELFKQEANVLSALNHSGIPQVDHDGYFVYYPRDQQEPLHCIVMEKIEGMNLEKYLQQRDNHPIKQKRALQWLGELATILEQVHNHNFFHRDIKPANIMLKANGSLVLIDFGSVRQVTATYLQKRSQGQVTGVISTGYTPMEQIKGKAVQQSDFYALGGTMIFLLTAQNPSEFYDPTTDNLNWRSTVPDIYPQFADLIDQLIAPLPRSRPQTAEEILRAIAAIDPELDAVTTYFGTPSQSSPSPSISQVPVSIPPNPSPSQPKLNQDFLNRCQQELAEMIGPMATIICRRTLNQNPNVSELEFIDLLVKKIPSQEEAREFKEKLLG